MHDQFEYSRASIERLVEAGIWKGRHYVEVEGAWSDIRSSIERTGDVESEAWLEVLDLENAIASLRGEHPEAALVVVAIQHNFTREEIRSIRNFDRLAMKAKAYLTAYMNGDDPEEAYRRAGRSPARVA